jgi:hypothetical protein
VVVLPQAALAILSCPARKEPLVRPYAQLLLPGSAPSQPNELLFAAGEVMIRQIPLRQILAQQPLE